MKLAALVCAGLLAGLHPTPADACSCIRRRVTAAIEKTAPTNPHVLLWFSDGVYSTAPSFMLRQARGKRLIAVTRRDVKAGAITVAELVPKRPLRAKTAYEVVDSTGAKVLEFTTTAGKDSQAPAWQGMQQARYVQQPGACCVCNTGAPHIRVDTGAVSDDQGADGAVFAVWTADAGGKIDYKEPPTTYVRSWGAWFSLGHPSICGRNNLDLPTGKTLRVGVRPVDLAGNLGATSELEIDLSKPPTPIPDL